MTAYIGNNEIRHVLYFNRNKNTIINDRLTANLNYMDVNNRHEYYNDKFVILTDPSIYIAGIYYLTFDDIPDFIFYNNNFILKEQSYYSPIMLYHSTKPITRSCSYGLEQISYDSNIRYTYYKTWTYEFDGYNFDYKKESWWVDSQGVQSTITVEDEQHIDTNQITALIIKGPTNSNNTYDVIKYKINDNDIVFVPNDFKSYKNISKLYAGEELVHENT